LIVSRVAYFVICASMLATSTARPLAQGASAAPSPVKATVQQLDWIAGAWSGTLGDRTIEQHWSAPAAGSIMAMYRSIRNNQVQLYELLAIEQEGDAVVLRIKHFAPGPGLVGREAKEESANHTLVQLDGRTAVFQGTGDNPAKVRFSSPDAQTLTIVVERLRDGAPVSTEFKYTRLGGS
jgi:hypothetical protein